TAAIQVGLVENLNVRHFRQYLIKRPAFVRIDRANQKCDVVRQPSGENGAELLQWLEHVGGFPFHIVGKKIRAFEPDQLAAAEKWKCLQRRDGGTNCVGGAVYIVGRAIDNLESEFARFGGRELFGEICRFAFYPGFVGTDDRTNARSRSFGFGFRHSRVLRICSERSQGQADWEPRLLACLSAPGAGNVWQT